MASTMCLVSENRQPEQVLPSTIFITKRITMFPWYHHMYDYVVWLGCDIVTYCIQNVSISKRHTKVDVKREFIIKCRQALQNMKHNQATATPWTQHQPQNWRRLTEELDAFIQPSYKQTNHVLPSHLGHYSQLLSALAFPFPSLQPLHRWYPGQPPYTAGLAPRWRWWGPCSCIYNTLACCTPTTVLHNSYIDGLQEPLLGKVPLIGKDKWPHPWKTVVISGTFVSHLDSPSISLSRTI